MPINSNTNTLQETRSLRSSSLFTNTDSWVSQGSASSNDLPTDDSFSTRRNFLLTASSTVGVVSTAAVVQGNSPFTLGRDLSQNEPKGVIMGVDEAIQWIDQSCDRRFLHAVISSDYQFLYRGVANDSEAQISIRKETPDLLLPGTYNDEGALVWFEELESILDSEKVKPSNGHLATASIQDASQWGTAVSIWPKNNAHYAWFEDEGLFYPRRSSISRSDIIIDGKDCGKHSLEDALQSESCEVMVASPNDSFLVVPASLDEKLREGLKNSFLI